MMDEVANDANGCKNESYVAMESDKDVDHVDGVDDLQSSESKSLLPPRKGGMSKSINKSRRKVQWNDSNGDKLTEVLEFQPSDKSDSDSDDEDKDSCICTIM